MLKVVGNIIFANMRVLDLRSYTFYAAENNIVTIETLPYLKAELL